MFVQAACSGDMSVWETGTVSGSLETLTLSGRLETLTLSGSLETLTLYVTVSVSPESHTESGDTDTVCHSVSVSRLSFRVWRH